MMAWGETRVEGPLAVGTGVCGVGILTGVLRGGLWSSEQCWWGYKLLDLDIESRMLSQVAGR